MAELPVMAWSGGECISQQWVGAVGLGIVSLGGRELVEALGNHPVRLPRVAVGEDVIDGGLMKQAEMFMARPGRVRSNRG